VAISNGRSVAAIRCLNCHGPEWYNNFYTQYYNTVDIYDHNFGKPASEIMARLGQAGKITGDASCLQRHGEIFTKDYGEFVNIHVSVKNIRGSKYASCHQ